MKNKIFFLVIALIGCIFYSCDSDDLEYQNEFETSKKVWLEFKETNNDSYKYTVVNGSWVGWSSETTITVENGLITQRHFEYTSTEGLSEDIPESELQWTETETEIGSHENGAEPMIMGEIYNRAEQDWLTKRKNTTTYFENENNGMISSCGYVEDNCADDCFIGITINNIQPL